MTKNKNKGHKGYIGIPELLVVTVIIAVLTVVVAINYPAAKKQLALQRSASQMAQDIRRVQEMALASEIVGGAIPEGGYGIYLATENPNKYILFADQDGDEEYDDAVELIEEIETEGGVEIAQLNFQDCPSWFCTDLIILYTPPDPIVNIKVRWTGLFWTDVLWGEGFIKLSINGSEKNILVNKVGLINIE